MTVHLTAFTACLAVFWVAFAGAASLPPHHGDGAAIVTTHTGD